MMSAMCGNAGFLETDRGSPSCETDQVIDGWTAAASC